MIAFTKAHRNLLFLVLCTFQFYIGSHQQDDIDSNKVLTDFIWAKIISAGKSSSSSGSSSMKNMMPPNIPLVTIPYKPKPKARSTTSTLRSAPSSPYISSSSLKSSQRTKSLSRRSSYSLLNHLSSNSSPSYTFEGVGTKNVKYIPENQKTSISSRVLTANYPTFTEMSDVSASKTIDKKTTQSGVNNQQQQSKSDRFNSVTESVNGKEYQSNPTYQTETTEKTGGSSRHQELSKSIYDLVPMPTYGLSKYGSLKGGSLNDGTMNNQMNHQMKEDNNGGIDSNNMYQAKRTLEIVPMIDGKQSYGDQQQMEPQIIDVEPDTVPIQVVFRSRSTRVQVQQIHTPSKVEEVETSRTEEEPQRVKHQLFRPVIQEVLEIIQPYRMITQEVRPVLEQIHTVVSKQAPPETSNQQNYDLLPMNNRRPNSGVESSMGVKSSSATTGISSQYGRQQQSHYNGRSQSSQYENAVGGGGGSYGSRNNRGQQISYSFI